MEEREQVALSHAQSASNGKGAEANAEAPVRSPAPECGHCRPLAMATAGQPPQLGCLGEGEKRLGVLLNHARWLKAAAAFRQAAGGPGRGD